MHLLEKIDTATFLEKQFHIYKAYFMYLNQFTEMATIALQSSKEDDT